MSRGRRSEASKRGRVSALPPDPHWLRTRQRLLQQIKDQVQRRLGPEPEEIRRYIRRFDREFKADWKVSDKTELLRAVETADIVLGGDFHAFSQAQRTHLKILNAIPSRRPLVIALEAFQPKYQPLLDRYVKGEITESQLLSQSRWKSQWGFPWENYRPLADFAKERGLRLLAAGSTGRSLGERERDAARAISEEMRNGSRGALIYVVFGELHLASPHLPAILREEMADLEPRVLTVHLNSEKLYFSLASQGLEAAVDVVRLGTESFCVLASPPWVQWQSYLMYLEKAHDPDLDDETGAEQAYDPTDHVTALIRLAAHDLGLEFKCDDVSVYSAGDAGLWASLKAALSERDLRVARHLIESGRSFFIPKGGIFFLSRLTINHAAELAGQYIHSRLSGRGRTAWKMPQDFQALIWVEAVGFFVSKLVNHKRHSETLTDLKLRLEVASPQDQGRESLVIAIEQRLSELLMFHQGRRRKPRLKPRSRLSWLEAARILGGMMGERLYLAYRSRKLGVKTLLSLLRTDPTGTEFAASYDDIVRRLGPGTGALRTRKERL